MRRRVWQACPRRQAVERGRAVMRLDDLPVEFGGGGGGFHVSSKLLNIGDSFFRLLYWLNGKYRHKCRL